MTDQQLPTKPDTRNVRIREQYLPAAREASKLARLELTDAAKDFSTYVDDEGTASKKPHLIYINMTRMVYGPFGLNTEARNSLGKCRDKISAVALGYVMSAEQGAAEIIRTGMAKRENREDIKEKVRAFTINLAHAFKGIGKDDSAPKGVTL